jgi:uncharacterized damage-inducible protein DinB
MEPLIETWQINQRLNQYLLDALTPELLTTPLAKGKSVVSGFTHMHNVRLMWLKVCAPDLHEAQTKFEQGEGDIASIPAHLTSSGEAIAEVLRRAGSPDGKVKGFKPHATGFLGYFISHESFHRAHIEMALRQAGTPLSDKVAYGIWEWGVR